MYNRCVWKTRSPIFLLSVFLGWWGIPRLSNRETTDNQIRSCLGGTSCSERLASNIWDPSFLEGRIPDKRFNIHMKRLCGIWFTKGYLYFCPSSSGIYTAQPCLAGMETWLFSAAFKTPPQYRPHSPPSGPGHFSALSAAILWMTIIRSGNTVHIGHVYHFLPTNRTSFGGI